MKAILIFCYALLASIHLTAQNQGPVDPGKIVNEPLAGSNLVWNNAENGKVSDNSYADFDISSGLIGDYTDYLYVSQFGFNIPNGATINGIYVEIERSDPLGITADYSIRLIKGGSVGDGEYSTGIPYPASDAYQSYGGSNDLWGDPWTPADINNSSFGVAISAQLLAKGDFTAGQIDNVRITVYYSLVVLPLKLISFSASPKDNLVRLNWTTTDESSMDHFELQRSINANNFNTIANISCSNRTGTTNYSFDDNDPVNGNAWYRLQMISNSGSGTYSKIVSARYNPGYNMSLYPSSLKAGDELFVNNPGHERITIELFNNSGQSTGNIVTTTNHIETTLLTGQKGLYYYKLLGDHGELKGSGKLIVY